MDGKRLRANLGDEKGKQDYAGRSHVVVTIPREPLCTYDCRSVKSTIESIIASIASRNADRRHHVFKVQVDSATESSVTLAGKVLTQADKDLLRREILAQMPDARIDEANLKVLRKSPPDLRTVATNLTDLHVEPSFLSEMLTQVLNGVTLEVLEEQDKWCFVRQTDGYMGWVYREYLEPHRGEQRPSHWIAAESVRLFAEPQETEHPLSRLLIGTGVIVTEMRGQFAKVQPAGTLLPAGWAKTSDLRAIASSPLPLDAARAQMVADARRLSGIYYLWGGNTSWGTDCSGLAQLVHRLVGYVLPRDCDLQFAASREVSPPYHPGDLFFFHSETNFPAQWDPKLGIHVT